MTPSEAAYRAGCITAEVDARFGGKLGLAPSVLNKCAQLPGRLPVVLRQHWAKASKDPAVRELLAGYECPDRPVLSADQMCFWIGFYHQRTARNLPADFGPRVTSLRESAGLNGQELADLASLSRQRLHQLEAGTHRPTWAEVQQLAAALKVPTDTFRDQA